MFMMMLVVFDHTLYIISPRAHGSETTRLMSKKVHTKPTLHTKDVEYKIIIQLHHLNELNIKIFTYTHIGNMCENRDEDMVRDKTDIEIDLYDRRYFQTIEFYKR
jgi:hypothetical protein